jgi:hypothetical protein
MGIISAGGKYCAGVGGGVAAGVVPGTGALPAAAIWPAPHFGQKRSSFANWFPHLTQNAIAYLGLLVIVHSGERNRMNDE